MRLPTVRQALLETSTPLPPLDISVTQSIEDRVQTYVLQEAAYGLHKKSKAPLQVIIWMWLGAALVFAGLLYGDIRDQGLQAFLADFKPEGILPGVVMLALLTIGYLLWSRSAPRRRKAGYHAHLRSIDGVAPRTVGFRFDGDGITVTEPGGMVQVQPWHENLVLTEDERWICFLSKMNELGIVIPKQELSAEQVDAVRIWNERRAEGGRPQEPTLPPELAGREVSRSCEFSSDRNDMMAVLLEGANAPAWRTRRLRSFGLLALALCLLMPALYLVGWLIDPDRLPFSITWPLYVELFITQFWQPALAAIAVVIALAMIHPVLRRWGARYYADQMLASGLGQSTVIIGENGLWDGGTAIRMFIPWNEMRACRITPEHILLTVRLGAVVGYPKRVFPADQVAAIESLFSDRAGKARPEGASA